MTLYLIRRLIMSFVVIVLVMTFLGLLVHLIPGDPVKTIMGPRASPALAALVRKQMELDKPVPTQVYDFIRHALVGNLGIDFVSQVSVIFPPPLHPPRRKTPPLSRISMDTSTPL